MKFHRLTKLFGTLLLIIAPTVSYEAHATPQHHLGVRGVIQTIDYTNRSLTVLDQKNVEKTFVWNSRTWFRQKSPKPCASWFSRLFSFGKKTTVAALQPGRTVVVYWRRESGRAVAREIVVFLPSPARACPDIKKP